MVSIPDWSRLGRLVDANNAPGKESARTRYNKHREAETIKAVEEQGYFLTATKSFIEDQFYPEDPDHMLTRTKSFLDEEGPPKDLSKVKFIKLVGVHLRTVGDVGLCNRLRICILHHNYITKFDGLEPCTQLMKLDLHSNQIASVPGPAFWSRMHDLKILHLHDNPIGNIENLHFLAATPALYALTLSDTPLSLKRNYRHHVVNSIWSLKALDNCVISDEEIIEDAQFGGIFSAFNPYFKMELCPPTPEDFTYEEETLVAFQVLADINRILAHCSPVMLIQRHIRGYLTRKYSRFSQENKIWAALTIQRKYRDWKGVPTPQTVPPPPTSPVMPQDGIKIDYDTYIQNRRPGSVVPSEGSITSRHSRMRDVRVKVAEANLLLTINAHQDGSESEGSGPLISETVTEGPDAPANSAASDTRKGTRIFVNLAKLHAETLQNLQDEDTIVVGSALVTEKSGSKDKTDYRVYRKRQEPKKKLRKAKSVKQFFGPVVDPPKTPEAPNPWEVEEEKDNVPMVGFRLRGFRQRVRLYDPTAEMILSRREAGRDIREAEAEHHHLTDNAPKPILPRKQHPSVEQRMFNKVQGTMGMSCLRAVHQAYRDREKAERHAGRMEFVMRQKEHRADGRHRVKVFQEEKKGQVLDERKRDHRRVLDYIEKREVSRLNYIDKTVERRQRNSHHIRHKRGELTFMGDFQVQNTSVSNALMRHDRAAAAEDKMTGQSDLVQGYREMEKDQQDVVKKYMEHRQLMRQTETAMARASLDTRMLQEANERLMDARTRVAQQKARTHTLESMYKVPSLSTHSLPPLDPLKDMKGLDRWGSQVIMSEGHVGKHHTAVV